MTTVELLLADAPPETIGRVSSFVILCSLLLAGIVKCIHIARRPATNSLCVYSLLLLLTGLLVSSLVTFLTYVAALPLAGRLAIVAVILICYVASAVTAIIGLADYRKHAGTYNQGRKQAVTAIIASSLLLFVLGGAVAVRVATMIEPDLAVGESRGLLPGPKSDGKFSRTRRLESLNLMIDLPDLPWVEVDAKKLNPAATLTLMRSRPQIGFMLIGERAGVEQELTTSSLAELYRANLRSVIGNVTFTEERAETYSSLNGIAMEGDAIVAGRPFHYAVWAVARNGFVYQLVTYGDQVFAAEIEAARRQFCSGFRQIDPSEVAHVEGVTPARDHVSPAFGYRALFARTDWTEWSAEEYTTTGADFGASCGPNTVLELFAIRLPAGRPDAEMLAKSMLGGINIKYPGPSVVASAPLEIGPLRGLAIETRSQAASGVMRRCLARVLSDDKRAFLIIGLADENESAKVDVIKAALDRVEIDDFAEAAEPSLSQPQQVVTGLILNELGLSALEGGNAADAVAYFEKSAELRPDEQVIAGNLISALLRSSGADVALAELERRLDRFPESMSLRALQANMLATKGETSRSRQIYTQLFTDGHDDEDDLLTYINLAVDTSAFDEAISTVEQFLKRRPSAQVRRWLATVHSHKGDHEKAIALLVELRNQSPSDRRTAYSLADAYEAKGDFSAALEISKQLLTAGAHDETTLMLHGRNQLQLHWYAQAKETFGKVLAINPGNADAKEYLAHSSNMLGQGDNSLVTRPLAPVEIPELVRSAIRGVKVPASATADSADAVEVLRVTGIDYAPGKRLRTTNWRKVKIHTTGGVTRYSTLTVNFDPSAERVFVNRLAVFDEQGQKVADGSVDDYYVLDDDSSGTATQDKVLNLPVPALKPGHTLEFAVTTEELSASDDFRYQEFLLTSSVPVGMSIVFVRGDVSSLLSGTTAPATAEKASDLIYVILPNPVVYSWESYQPFVEHFLPMIWLGDSRSTWPVVARKYLEEIKDKLTPTDETRNLAAELTADSKTPREKMRAIAEHVQRTCTYRAIEFGRRAQIPNAASQTVRLKYGDCKDHAVLVHDLLQAAGVTSHLALVNTAGRLRLDMPSLDQFNHMIVYVPDAASAAGGTIIDCTDKETFALTAPQPNLADRDVLVLDPENPRLIHTPNYPPDAARMISRRKVKIRVDESGGPVETHIEEQISLNEYAAPAMRAFLKAFGPADRPEAVQSWFAGGSSLRLKNVTIENLEETKEPLVLEMEYAAPDAFHLVGSAASGGTMVGQLPASWEMRYLEAEYVPHRKTPFEFWMPMRIESTTNVDLPAGYEMQDVDRLVVRGSTQFVSWASRAEAKGPTVTLEYRARRLAGRHPATEYAAYYKDVNDALGVFRRPVTLQSPVP